MKLKKLKQLCLQYLEQDDETNVIEEELIDLQTNDTFAEYLYNMDHVIYQGLARLVSAKILPLQMFELPKGTNICELVEKGTKKPIFHEITEVFALTEDGTMAENVKYTIVGSKIILQKIVEGYTYYVVYHPTIHMLDTYLTRNLVDINEIELTDIGDKHICIPDDMAINLKYLVYSEMKLEENPSVANANKNYFESYIASMQTVQIQRSQVEVQYMDWGDSYGD